MRVYQLHGRQAENATSAATRGHLGVDEGIDGGAPATLSSAGCGPGSHRMCADQSSLVNSLLYPSFFLLPVLTVVRI